MAWAIKAAPVSYEPDLEQSNEHGPYVDTIVPFLHPREHSAEVGPVLREQQLALAIERKHERHFDFDHVANRVADRGSLRIGLGLCTRRPLQQSRVCLHWQTHTRMRPQRARVHPPVTSLKTGDHAA